MYRVTQSVILLIVIFLVACVQVVEPDTVTPQPQSQTLQASVRGLVQEQTATLRLLSGIHAGSHTSVRNDALREWTVADGTYTLTFTSPDGAYTLIIDAPPAYIRDPAGYILRVSDGNIVNDQDRDFAFNLTPPSQQTLPPCRLYTPEPGGMGGVVCVEEGVVDLSAPLKRGEPEPLPEE